MKILSINGKRGLLIGLLGFSLVAGDLFGGSRESKTAAEAKMRAEQDLLLDFVNAIVKYIKELNVEQNNRKLKEHDAMLRRLAYILDYADSDQSIKNQLVDLIAVSSKSLEQAYNKLEKQVTLWESSQSFLTTFNPQNLLAKASELQKRDTFFSKGSYGLLSAIATRTEVLSFSEDDKKIQKKVFALLDTVFQQAQDKSNDTVKRNLIALLRSIADDLKAQTLTDKRNIAILNKIIGTCLILGPEHAYEDVEDHATIFERYISRAERDEESRRREARRKPAEPKKEEGGNKPQASRDIAIEGTATVATAVVSMLSERYVSSTPSSKVESGLSNRWQQQSVAAAKGKISKI